MDKRKFTLWNRISAAFVLVVSAVTYLLTIEPTASFWDCGECHHINLRWGILRETRYSS